MKTPLKGAALMAAVALVLSACSSGGEGAVSPSPTPPALTNADLSAFVWTEVEGVPTLTFDTPAVMTSTAARVVADGTGDLIEDGMLLEASYTIFSGLDGSLVYSSYDTGQTETLPVASLELDPVLYDALVGSHVGATILYGAPDYSVEAASGVFFAMTIVSGRTPLLRAEGTPVEPVDGLPAVTLDETGKPFIDLSEAVKPEQLVSQLLIEGEGEPVALGDNITVHYTGWLWDGEQFDSSWEGGSPHTWALVPGGLIDGWIEGLQGVPVGSQVLLVVPPDMGYGEAGQGSIPGGATLVFVVDVLSAA